MSAFGAGRWARRGSVFALRAILLVMIVGATACSSVAICNSEACRDDIAITEDVRAALAMHPALQAWQLGVQAIDHVVYLRGLVDTDQERAEAESVARAVVRVSDVVNSIAVRNSSGN